MNKIQQTVASLAVAGIAFSSFATAPLMAQDSGDANVTAVVAPRGEWMEILPDEIQWYQVNYDFIERDGNIISEAIVQLEMGAEDSISFEVYTAGQAAEWAKGEDVEPIGAGSTKPNQDKDVKLIWSSSSEADETFYIVVQNERDVASYYALEVEGDGISSPVGSTFVDVADETTENTTESVTDEEEMAADEEEMAADEEAVENNDGDSETTPNSDAATEAESDALVRAVIAPTNNTRTLGPRQIDWYQVDYTFVEQNDKTISEALVELTMGEPDSIAFEIYTPKEARLYTLGEEIDPIGAGSSFSDGDEESDTVLVWSNSTETSETFYVVVMNLRNVPSSYDIEITGTGISFPVGTFAAPEIESAAEETTAEEIATEETATEGAEAGTDDEEITSSEDADEDGVTAVIAPTGDWLEMGPREVQWYQVNYDFAGSDSEVESEVLVELEMGEEDTVSLEIYTPTEVRLWSDGEEFDPIGVGGKKSELTGNENHDTKLVWNSTSAADETFYIIVTNLSDEPSYYTIDISGAGISFPLGSLERAN